MKNNFNLGLFITKAFIVICILIITVMSVSIGIRLLSITSSFTQIFKLEVSNYIEYMEDNHSFESIQSFSEVMKHSNEAYNNKEGAFYELEKLVELNNAVFTNNFLNFIYAVITSLFLTFGGVVLNRSLNYKNEAEKIIEQSKKQIKKIEMSNEKKLENIDEKYDKLVLENAKIKHYEYLMMKFENATNLILYIASQGNDKENIDSYIARFRDKVYDIKAYLLLLQSTDEINPFPKYDKYENESLEIFNLKITNILLYIAKSTYKNVLYAPIEMLNESTKILSDWRE